MTLFKVESENGPNIMIGHIGATKLGLEAADRGITFRLRQALGPLGLKWLFDMTHNVLTNADSSIDLYICCNVYRSHVASSSKAIPALSFAWKQAKQRIANNYYQKAISKLQDVSINLKQIR